jgi:hypothetical protein
LFLRGAGNTEIDYITDHSMAEMGEVPGAVAGTETTIYLHTLDQLQERHDLLFPIYRNKKKSLS